MTELLLLLLLSCCASFSLWLTSPFNYFPQKTCAWEGLCWSPGSHSCAAFSPWSIREEKSLCFTQLKQGAASIIASFRAAGYHRHKTLVILQVNACQSFKVKISTIYLPNNSDNSEQDWIVTSAWKLKIKQTQTKPENYVLKIHQSASVTAVAL